MYVVCVHVSVKPEHVNEFLSATRANAAATLAEPGALRFDILQAQEEAGAFLLYEVYRDTAAAAAHKETPHYATWRDAVEPWMAAPRRSAKYDGRFPEAPEGWAVH
jgi:autoinducer 2-degrading protein